MGNFNNYTEIKRIQQRPHININLIKLKNDEKYIEKTFQIYSDNLPIYQYLREITNYTLISKYIKNNIGLLTCEGSYYYFRYPEQNIIFLEMMDINLKYWVLRENFDIRLKHFDEFYNQIATGLLNLHSLKIIHNRVHPYNILIKEDKIYEFKLCDLTNSLCKDLIIHFNKYTKWSAPELIADRNPHTYSFEKIDLWSFGLCCLYYLTGEIFVKHESKNNILIDIYNSSLKENKFVNFEKHIKNGTINGSIDVDKFIKQNINENINIDMEIINKIQLLLQLNPKDRRIIGLEKPIIFNNINNKNIKTNCVCENQLYKFKYYYVVNMFTNMFEFEKLLCLEVGNRYFEINPEMKENDMFIIIYIIKKYTLSTNYIDCYKKLLSGYTIDEFDEKAYDILKKLKFQLYNPEFNYIYNKNDERNIYVYKSYINIDTLNYLLEIYTIEKFQYYRTTHLALYYYDLIKEQVPNYPEKNVVLSCLFFASLYTEKKDSNVFMLPKWESDNVCRDVLNKLMKLPKVDIYLPYDYINENHIIKMDIKVI